MKNSAKIISAMGASALMLAGGVALTTARNSQAQSAAPAADSGVSGKNHGMRGMFGKNAVRGTAASVSGGGIALTGENGTAYAIDASSAKITKIDGASKSEIQISGIAAGDTLTVFGTVSGSSVAATEIIDGKFPQKMAPAASGTVSGISGNSFTLTDGSASYAVDAGNAQITIMKPAGTALQNSGIQNGDTVTVFGTVSGANIAATHIMDGSTAAGRGMPGGMMKFGHFNKQTNQ